MQGGGHEGWYGDGDGGGKRAFVFVFGYKFW